MHCYSAPSWLVLALWAFLGSDAALTRPTCVTYFHSSGCGRCVRIDPVIKRLEDELGPLLKVERIYPFGDMDNLQLFGCFKKALHAPNHQQGIPFLAGGNTFLQGDDIARVDEDWVKRIEGATCGCPMEQSEL
eukprot:TRINITY_DN6736_c0_g1_i1.p1 TRINITY_DN6736_c0_g1~~TRINITY_DN6736_c0_g1_i1.p1  ORF type:complete len:144 (-),score=15.91 TRINITY_DN6736_c0_g1_i1:5-403(-)